ncbi:hypothetical protein BC937DRAFT_89141 [Endogone sp. FLAS-F59071]|nr:hypothetical protein BC937DRAFT_89141 [Endogone sp. FLAS-F59071]|eukprot:RUS18111.1 hypothetical protein BC937DRAFT_89141 [Endogone sp. FLAS-F59071]
MRALLGNYPLVHYNDQVCVLDCRKPVRDHNCAAVLGGNVKGALDQPLRRRVEGGGGFVEEEDSGILDQSTCNGDALLLAAGEHAAMLRKNGTKEI